MGGKGSGGKRAEAGRKRLPADIKKSGEIWLRVTREEKEKIKTAAEKKGESVSEFCRSAVLASAEKTKP